MQNAQAAPLEIHDAAERVQQVPRVGGQLHRHRVDAEVAPVQVLSDGRRQDTRQRARRLVPLAARGRDVDAPVPARADGGREKAFVLDERALQGVGERARHRGPVALDDDVEIAARRLPAPGVAHETAGHERPRAVARRHAGDLGEQRPRRRRQRLFEPGPHGERAGRGGTRDGALARHDHGRRALAQRAPHGELRRAWPDDRQRPREIACGQIAEPQGVGAREILGEDVMARAARQDAHTAAAGESQRIDRGDARWRREHLAVDEIGGDQGDLRIRVGTACHRRQHDSPGMRRCGVREAPPRCSRGARRVPTAIVI